MAAAAQHPGGRPGTGKLTSLLTDSLASQAGLGGGLSLIDGHSHLYDYPGSGLSAQSLTSFHQGPSA